MSIKNISNSKQAHPDKKISLQAAQERVVKLYVRFCGINDFISAGFM